jgi:small basic protein
MLALVLALALGVTLGLLTNVSVPVAWLTYLGVAVLAAIDACLGGVKASLEETFDDKVFVSGFLTNTLMAAFIVFVGDRIGVRELYLAAVVAFGMRVFENLGTCGACSSAGGGGSDGREPPPQAEGHAGSPSRGIGQATERL